MNGRFRTTSSVLVVALALTLPASASAFPYLTLAAAKRAISRYQRSWYQSEEQGGSWTISDCDHETLDPVLVWCRVNGISWPIGERSRWQRWKEWNWAELLPDDQIEAGSGE